MQVILLERIGRLGQMGEVVTVKDGYARNYLLPQGKALRATKANMENFDQQRVTLEAHNLERKTEADAVAVKVDGQTFIVIRQAGDSGQLYGSVSTRDIASNITEAGIEVARQQVRLDRPIKILGLHPVRVALHPEVEITVTVNVARTPEEAKRQARGEDVSAQSDEPFDESEDAIGVEEVFEDQDLAREVEEELKEDESEVGAGEDESSAQDAPKSMGEDGGEADQKEA